MNLKGNCRQLGFLFVTLPVLSLAIYFEPTHCVRGCLWGEAFFNGRPTSYWRGVVERDLQIDPDVFLGRAPPPLPSFWQRWHDWVGYRPALDSSRRLLDHDAELVLRELRQNDNANIAGFATNALDGVGIIRDLERLDVERFGANHDVREARMESVSRLWLHLVLFHSLKRPENQVK